MNLAIPSGSGVAQPGGSSNLAFQSVPVLQLISSDLLTVNTNGLWETDASPTSLYYQNDGNGGSTNAIMERQASGQVKLNRGGIYKFERTIHVNMSDPGDSILRFAFRKTGDPDPTEYSSLTIDEPVGPDTITLHRIDYFEITQAQALAGYIVEGAVWSNDTDIDFIQEINSISVEYLTFIDKRI